METIIVNDENTYDVLIIGAGPAGLTSALYTSRAGYKTGFIERSSPGGKIVNLKNITNFPGSDNINGQTLANNLFEQAKSFGAKYLYGDVSIITKKLGYYSVTTKENELWLAKVIIVATGTENVKLKCPGSDEYNNMGISYCVLCDGYLAKDKKVVVIGNNKEAISSSMYLSTIAKQTTLLYLDKIPQETKLNNIKLYENVRIESVIGSSFQLNAVNIFSNDGVLKIDCDFIFVNLGTQPAVSFLSEFKEVIGNSGTIDTDEKKQTKIPGIYAIGDVSKTDNRQIITACNDGAIAGINAVEYLNSLDK
ncbi:MAG: FAD-dependent oxidoreductase [Mycoplasmataceae bacterium]|nr:FAD-dependent oxidoreductase [Mycoplasmataceae bacterium]